MSASTEVPGAGDATEPVQHWGSFTLGGSAWAVPLAHLREAVPAERLTVWPGTAACVIGAVERRGLLLPVVDLRRLAGATQASRTVDDTAPAIPPLVVVIAHEGHLLGLCADAVTGLFQASPARLQAVTLADGSEPCVRGALHRPDRDELVSVLHPPALMALPQVPRCRDPRAAATDPASHPGSHPASHPASHMATAEPAAMHWLLARAGDWRLAIDSARVRMAVPLDGLRPSVLSQMRGNTDCIGEWPHPSQPIVVIDPLRRTGLGALAAGEARQALLLDTDAGLLGLAIGAVLDVCRLAPSALQPLPGGRVSQPDWFAGVLDLPNSASTGSADSPDAHAAPDAPDRFDDSDGSGTANANANATGPVLALDARRWTSHADLTGMASLHGGPVGGRGGASAQATDATSARALTLITYALPAEAGTPIDQVDEVLPWPTAAAGLDDDARSPWLGLLMHRGRPIVLLCLRRWSGVAAGPVEAGASILVVRSGAHRLGVVVPRLLAIESAGWQPAVSGVMRSRKPTPISAARLAQVRTPGGAARLIPVLDLRDIAAHALAARPAVVPVA